MKTRAILFAGALIAAGATASQAQSDNHAAEGVVAPYAPRYLDNGDVAPPPALRANGGVGANEMPFTGAQTLTGGPSGAQTDIAQ